MNYYLLGVIVGILIVLTFALITCLIRRKINPGARKYDERQMVGRGKSFQAGFFTLIIAQAGVSIWEFTGELPGEPLLWHIGAILLGVAVFALTAIHYDAYVSMNDSPKHFLRMGLCFILAMTSCGIHSLHSGRPESLVIGAVSLEVCAVWILIVAALLIHRARVEDEE